MCGFLRITPLCRANLWNSCCSTLRKHHSKRSISACRSGGNSESFFHQAALSSLNNIVFSLYETSLIYFETKREKILEKNYVDKFSTNIYYIKNCKCFEQEQPFIKPLRERSVGARTQEKQRLSRL